MAWPRSWRPASAACAGVALLAAGGLRADPRVRVDEQESLLLRVRSLAAAAVDAPEGGFVLRPEGHRAGRLDFAVLWPDPARACLVSLVATRLAPRPGSPSVVRLEGRVDFPDGSRREAARELEFEGRTTALFEIARVDGRALTLVVEAESVLETVIAARPRIGPHVVLHLGVEWVGEGRAALLETNRLSTFVGEPVSYSFRLGDVPEAESIEVRLTPLALFGDVIELRAEVSGSVQRFAGTELIARREQWLISRGQSAALDTSAGEPATGFRFVVTPSF